MKLRLLICLLVTVMNMEFLWIRCELSIVDAVSVLVLLLMLLFARGMTSSFRIVLVIR